MHILHLMGANGIGKSTAIMQVAIKLGINSTLHHEVFEDDDEDSGIYFSKDNQFAIIGKFAKDGEVNWRSGEVSGTSKESVEQYLKHAKELGTKLVLMQGQLVNGQSAIRRHYNVVGDNQLILVLQAPYNVISARKLERAKYPKDMETYDELSKKQERKFLQMPAKIKTEFPKISVFAVDATQLKEDIVNSIMGLLKSKGLV